MVDMLILVVLGWCSWFGWKRGFLRTCIDAAALILPLFVITLSVPLLKGVLLEQGWSHAFSKWMAGHLVKTSPQSSGFLNEAAARPVVQGLGSTLSPVVERLYDLLLIGLSAGGVYIGLQMILRVYETLWRDAHGVWQSRMTGGVLGLGIGMTVSGYLLSVLGLLCWIRGFEWLDQELMHSLFMHSLYRLIFW